MEPSMHPVNNEPVVPCHANDKIGD